MKNRNKQGFTLVELMVVIAIIGILAAVAIPNFMSYRQTGYNGRAKTQAKNLYTAVLAYLSDPDVSATSVATEGDNLPGFNKDPDVVISNVTWSMDNTGTLSVSATQTFKHNDGDKTYNLIANGNISSN